jgi:hypothetical protein
MSRDRITSLLSLKEMILQKLTEGQLSVDSDMQDRILTELALVALYDQASYVLNIVEFSAALKELRIPFLSGHPTGNSSLLLNVLGVTEVNPSRYGFEFETFMQYMFSGGIPYIGFMVSIADYPVAHKQAVDMFGKDFADNHVNDPLANNSTTLSESVAKSQYAGEEIARSFDSDYDFNNVEVFRLLQKPDIWEMMIELGREVSKKHLLTEDDYPIEQIKTTRGRILEVLNLIDVKSMDDLILISGLFFWPPMINRYDSIVEELRRSIQQSQDMVVKNCFIEEVTSESFGVLVYREQLDSLMSSLGGFSIAQTQHYYLSLLRADINKRHRDLADNLIRMATLGALAKAFKQDEVEQALAIINHNKKWLARKCIFINWGMVAYRLALMK